MTPLVFTALGPPTPKQRARRGKNGHWYTPERTVQYEATIRNMASLAVPRGWPLDARYSVDITAWLPDGRPRDLDNIAKAVLDGCQRVTFANDSQVVEVTARRGGIDRANPRTVVTIRVIEGGAHA